MWPLSMVLSRERNTTKSSNLGSIRKSCCCGHYCCQCTIVHFLTRSCLVLSFSRNGQLFRPLPLPSLFAIKYRKNVFWGFSRSGNPILAFVWHSFIQVVLYWHWVPATLQGHFLSFLQTNQGVLRCVPKVLLTSFYSNRCALAKSPWEIMKVSTTFHVEPLIPSSQVLFAPRQVSASIVLLKAHTFPKFGENRFTFEYLINCFLFVRTQAALWGSAPWALPIAAT